MFQNASFLCLLLAAAAVLSANGDLPQQQLCSCPTAMYGYIIIRNVPETTPLNTVLSWLEIVGNDAQIQLQMTPNEFIRFNATSRELVVYSRFNVTGGTPMSLNLNITCSIRATSQTILLQVIVQVYSMNTLPPSFGNLPYSVNISERTSVNTTVFSGVVATDPNPCDFGYLVYSLQDNGIQFTSYFSFSVPGVGNLVLMKPLSYETVQTISIIITVKDNGNNITILGQIQPQHTVTTTMTINIMPADDYNPVFNQSTYTSILPQDVLQGARLIISPPILAYIKYAKTEDAVVYSIIQDPNNADSSKFVIDNTTGVITASRSSDFRFTANVLAFQVQATKVNETWRSSTALVKVNVIGSDKTFMFTQRVYSAALSDDAPSGTLVITVATVNGVQTPTYSFIGDVKDFSIGNMTGEIRTLRNLDYKTVSKYNLSVSATDKTSSDTCLVTVTVNKFNESNPRFSQHVYKFNFAISNNLIGQVQATDDGSSSSLTYRLIDLTGLFTIDSNGRIECLSCTSKPQSNCSSSYSMVVIVEDDGSPPRQDSALVVVLGWDGSWAEGPLIPSAPLCSGSDNDRTKAFFVALIVLAVVSGVFLLIIIILTICLCTKKWSSGTVPPKVTTEADHSRKPCTSSSAKSDREVWKGFDVTKEYGPYIPYGSAEHSDDIIIHNSSILSSRDKIQKLRIYNSIPTPRSEAANRDGSSYSVENRPGASSRETNISRKSQNPPDSSNSLTISSTPSSRVERYRFEDENLSESAPSKAAEHRTSVPRSASPERRVSNNPAVYHSIPKRIGRPIMGSLRDTGSGGDTSSTETLVTPVKTVKPKISNVSFIENPEAGGYMSSQEAMDASLSALARAGVDESGITVYY